MQKNSYYTINSYINKIIKKIKKDKEATNIIFKLLFLPIFLIQDTSNFCSVFILLNSIATIQYNNHFYHHIN